MSEAEKQIAAEIVDALERYGFMVQPAGLGTNGRICYWYVGYIQVGKDGFDQGLMSPENETVGHADRLIDAIRLAVNKHSPIVSSALIAEREKNLAPPVRMGAREWLRNWLRLQAPPPRPTIAELEAIMAEPVEQEIIVLPDGQICVEPPEWVVQVLEAYAQSQPAPPTVNRELLKALKVIAIALAEPSGGEYWRARKLADEWGIFNDDLEGSRVLLRIAEQAIGLAEGK